MMKKALTLTAVALAASAASAAEVKYMLWDSNQLPAYQQCAADFQKANPGTTIKITQAGWDDYWTAISTGFVSVAGTAGAAPSAGAATGAPSAAGLAALEALTFFSAAGA